MPTAISIGNMFGGNASGASSGGTPIPPPPSGGFTMTVDTTLSGPSGNDQFEVKFRSGNTYNCDIDWGDGTTDTITAYNDAALLHTYGTGGTYTVEITGTIGNLSWGGGGDILKITNISHWGGSDLSIGGASFAMRAYAGTITATDSPTISGTMTGYFFQTLFTSGISAWNMGNATNCLYFLLSNTNWNEDISGWDVGNITSFSNAFSGGGLSTANYDLLLNAWSTQTVQTGVPLSVGSTKYTIATSGAARTTLVGKGWSISDGGGI
tara:strand:- start:89 stop:889 length:801 start_codon:yes stop_codon:yes gene_type:complete